MAKQNAPLFSFNQGEVSKLALARVDVAKLRLAAAAQVNWTPWALGPMMLRPGLIRIGEVLADAPAKLVPFIFSKLDVALLELTDQAMRIWVAEALVTRVTVATAISDPNFSTGTGWVTTGTTDGATATVSGGAGILNTVPAGGLARIRQIVAVSGADQFKEHGLRLTVSNGPVTVRVGTSAGDDNLVAPTVLDSGTHSLAFTPGATAFTLSIESTDAWAKTISGVTIDSAGALTLPTPWAADDLPNVRRDQSGDIVFVAAHGLQQHKVQRYSTNGWGIVLYRSSDGPFQPVPAASATFTPTAFYGNALINASQPYFQPGHVGALYRLFSSGQFYETRLGAADVFMPAVRVSGVGTDARKFTFSATSAGYVGTLTWQRSFDGPDSGFVDVSSASSGATGATLFTSDTGGSAGTPPLDNVVCWERVGFKSGNYVSGVVTVKSTYGGDGGFGIARVLAVVTSEQVSVEILSPLPSLVATTDWRESDWSDQLGWPDSGGFFDGRLFWAGRDQFWGSRSGNYVSYADEDIAGNALGDSGALNEQFGAGPVDTVSWCLGLTRLLAGREGSVASIRASAFDEVLTPTNISSKDCTTHGAARLAAVKIDTRGVYVEQSGRRVYELLFNPQALDYVPRDLTRLNIDIGKPGFVDIDVQRQPDTNVYLVRSDGQVAVLLHDAEDEIECWWRIQTAGVIENVCVLPDAGVEELVYFVVKRTLNGVTKRYIERLAHRDSCVGGVLNVQADCCLSYTGAPVSLVTAAWLANERVVVWADGKSLGATTADQFGNVFMPDGQAHSNIVTGLGGQLVIGSTAPRLNTGAAPDQVFEAASATLSVPALYEGCPAEVFADTAHNGKPVHIGAVTVSGALVTLPQGKTATVIIACLGYVAPFMSAKLAYAAQGGTALTQKKKLERLGLVMFDTASDGLQFGARFDALEPLPLVEDGAETPAGTVWDEYDEPMITVPGEWTTDARLCLLAQAPTPCTIGGVVVGITTNG